MGNPRYRNGFRVTLHEDKLDEPLRWRKPRRVFVNSMSDLFHEDVPHEFVESVFEMMAAAPAHTFQILTKRPGRAQVYVRDMVDRWTREPRFRTSGGPRAEVPLPNVWLGTSCENQSTADERIPHLMGTPAAVRFLSCEPLLGPIRLADVPQTMHPRDCAGPLGWVIVGGESGPKARPMHSYWVRLLRDECTGAGVPFFFKQWGGTNKKATGRELDGRTWDEMPAENNA
jgi:protein gp37